MRSNWAAIAVVFTMGLSARAQTAPPPSPADQAAPATAAPAAPAAAAPAPVVQAQDQEVPTSDVERFPQLRAQMEAAEAEFLKLNHDIVEVEIPGLLKRDRCHPRIYPELDKVVAAMKNFHKYETAYWTKVAEANKEQIAALESLTGNLEESVNSIEEKQKIEESEDQEAKKRLDELKQGGDETAAVRAEGEALVQQIQQTQAHLKDAMSELGKAQTTVQAHKDLIYFRKAAVDEGLRRLDAMHADFDALFKAKKATFASYCRPIVPPDEGPRIVPGPGKK